MHRHIELEFNLVVRGRATYLMERGSYALAPNTLLWLFPGQGHLLVHESPDFEMWVAVFKPGLIRKTALSSVDKILLEADPPGNHCRLVSGDEGRRLQKLLSRVVESKNRVHHFNVGLAHVLLDAWRSFQEARDLPMGDVHPAVEKTARAIRDESEMISMEELAKLSGLSASHLSRLFKKQTGVSLVDFRSRSRIERFKEIFRNGNRIKMLEAALEAGFGSYAQFHRIFKKITGVGPRTYRRSL